MTLLDIRDLSVWFGDRKAVDRASLTVEPGEVLGIVGESGSGKSMLARAALGLLPDGARRDAQVLALLGKDLLGADAETWRKLRGPGIGLVLQEPLTSLNPAMRIGEQMAEALELHRGLSRPEALARAARALEDVRIDEPEAALRRYPHEFSGGQRQRVMVASVLLLEPKLVIADEPATALDAVVGEEILDLIQARARAVGAAVMMISHDLAQVARRADRILVMEKGVIVDGGPSGDILLRPQHAYTRRLLAALPRRAGAGGRAERPAQPIVVARDLGLKYDGGGRSFLGRAPARRALRGVDFELAAGETLAVIGESGSGKSSLAMLTLGLLAPSEGTLTIDGRSWSDRGRRERRELRRRIQVVFQDPASSLDPRMRVAEIVGEGLREPGRAERDRRVAAALDEVGLDAGFAGRYPHQLSGGQRQRVAIARALVMDPEVLVADEPVSALDVTVQAQILDLLDRLRRERGFAMLFVTHDLGVVERLADRVMVMRDGRVVEAGTRDEVFDAPRDPYTRRLLSVAPVLVPEGDGYRLERRRVAAGEAA
ncbi:MAG: peptide transporter ATP-binding protein [Proteobacteria bacterium]|nr:peptide transporter ATP-binding protein [Pseudomonadota bacterium]